MAETTAKRGRKEMDKWKVIRNDALEALKAYPDNSFDAFFSDPPYGINFMGSKWDAAPNPGKNQLLPNMPNGAKFKSGGPSFDPEFWKEVYRVLKPGAPLLAFGGTRTYHRQTCAIEDAGFEIRDCLMWLYGSGFPKSHDISKGIDSLGSKEGVEERKRIKELIIASGQTDKEIAKVCEVSPALVRFWRRGERNIQPEEAARIGGKIEELVAEREVVGVQKNAMSGWAMDGSTKFKDRDITIASKEEAKTWEGYGTALKPAWEPCVLAMKPCDGTFAGNALCWGVAGLNLKECKVGNEDRTLTFGSMGCKLGKNLQQTPGGYGHQEGRDDRKGEVVSYEGRWPANLLLECICENPEVKSEIVSTHANHASSFPYNCNGQKPRREPKVKNNVYGEYGQIETGNEREVHTVIHTNPDCPAKILDGQSGVSTSNFTGYSTCAGAAKGVMGSAHGALGQSKKNSIHANDTIFKLGFTQGEQKAARNRTDTGGASRFFYCAKASTKEREAGLGKFGGEGKVKNPHPCLKPISLTTYLAKLLLPPKQEGKTRRLLVPFSGVGSEMIGALLAGWDEVVGIEKCARYAKISKARIKHWTKPKKEEKNLLTGIDLEEERWRQQPRQPQLTG